MLAHKASPCAACRQLQGSILRPALPRPFNSHSLALKYRLVHCKSSTQQFQTLPQPLKDSIAAATSSWLEHAVQNPLVDPQTNTKIYLLGTSHFSPVGLTREDLESVLDAVQPNILALELPFDTASRAGLPYPPYVQLLLESKDFGKCNQSSEHPWAPLLDGSKESSRIISEVLSCSSEARVGKDMFDPFEAYGLYPGLDFVRSPVQALTALQLFGQLPGAEYVAAVDAANERGVQVSCIDAPLRLQEAWVTSMLSEFGLEERDRARQLARELAAARAALPQLYEAWDMRLSQQVAQLAATSGLPDLLSPSTPTAAAAASSQPQQTEAAGSGSHDQGSGSGQDQERAESGQGASTSSSSSESGDGSQAAARQRRRDEVLMAAYKVSKATAAALLSYGAAEAALVQQARLQPLKYKHFARRALHMARQLRDLGQRFSIMKLPTVVDDVTTLTGAAQDTVAAAVTSSSSSAVGSRSAAAAASVGPEQAPLVVLALMGRQYVHTIEGLWGDTNSALWKGDVPRSFAPSTVKTYSPGEDPDVSQGGSRPVGHVAKTLGQ